MNQFRVTRIYKWQFPQTISIFITNSDIRKRHANQHEAVRSVNRYVAVHDVVFCGGFNITDIQQTRGAMRIV